MGIYYMSQQQSLIKELKNELYANEYYKKEVIEYLGRTEEQCKELLQKIENGEFDEIIETSYVSLNKLSKFDLNRKNSLKIGKPTLKEYRIFEFIDEVDDQISRISYIKSKEEVEITINKYKKLLNNLKNGLYDEILDKQNYWFGQNIDIDFLIFWDDLRNKTNECNDITLPNYIVSCVYQLIIEHINRINLHKKETGRNYFISSNGHEQTPITEEELKKLKILESEIMQTNYDWRESRSIVRKLDRLDIKNNYKFPHNIDEIINCFTKNKDIIYDKYDNNFKCARDVDDIVERAKKLGEYLSPNNFYTLFTNKNEDLIDEYLRKMIVSQLDGKLLSKKDYSSEKIKYMLNNPGEFSDAQLEELFQNILYSKSTLNEICDVALGTLYSLYNYKDKKVNILDDCIDLQRVLNCWRGTVSDYDVNTVSLTNGKRLISLPTSFINGEYSKFQNEYDYYCSNCLSDLEFVEGCTEIIGNVVTSQIFREGNKRTAKCLFNAMMVSNGIIPPIIDFTTNHSKLWDDFSCNINNYYRPAKQFILDETIMLKEYFACKNHMLT